MNNLMKYYSHSKKTSERVYVLETYKILYNIDVIDRLLTNPMFWIASTSLNRDTKLN